MDMDGRSDAKARGNLPSLFTNAIAVVNRRARLVLIVAASYQTSFLLIRIRNSINKSSRGMVEDGVGIATT